VRGLPPAKPFAGRAKLSFNPDGGPRKKEIGMTGIIKIARRTALAAIALFVLSPAALAENVKATFVLINDIYEMDEVKGRGGFPRVAAAVKAQRAGNPNTLVVNAGDLLSPSLLSGIDQGEHMIVLSNMIGTDVMTPGNHEFDFGKEIAFKRMGESKFPWIAANITQADGSPVPGMDGTLVKEIGGVKIGFVGLAEETTPELSSPGDLKFMPAAETAAAKAKELKDAGAEFVVAINHNARAVGQQLVDSGTVDLVLNGHNHDLWVFYNGKSAAMESQSDGYFISAVDINFNVEEKDGKHSISWAPTFRIHNSAELTPDPEVTAKVAEYKAMLDKELSVEIGSTAVELDSRKASVRGMETAMGNLVADALRKAVGADIAITNGGGIRGDKVYAAGSKITRKDILTELPFGNKTLMIEITGEQVRAALENGVSKMEEGAGRFPQVSGLSFTVDKSKPAGERISDIMVNGAPLDPAASYKVATNDFMARGGDGYTMFKEGKLLVNAESAKLMANDVMVMIREAGEVKAEGGQRITVK
jgi:2',3'-cyclic-nucleotide 2'-phosphodiesterase (5'-nucleotidase family)